MRIIGMAVCGRGESKRYMEKTLREFERLCDDTIIVTNDALPEDIEMINDFGFWHYADDRIWGVKQPLIKTELLRKVALLEPDWIIALDMDEIFPPEFTRAEAEALTYSQEVAWKFLVINLYNDKEHFAHGYGVQRFWNVRFFKFIPHMGLKFQSKRLHCGLAPPYAYKFAWNAPFYLEHYGLMLKEDRLKKAERYDKYDPKALFMDRSYYEELRKDLEPHPFNRQELLDYLKKECQPRKIPDQILSLSAEPMGA